MTADVAVPLWRDGKKETEESNESQVVKTLVQILGSANPEDTLLRAIYNDAIPDEICLELAEHLGELVKATNFDNRIETVFALRKGEAISEKTEQYLLPAILKMDEQEEVSASAAEIVISLPVPTLEAPTATPPLEPSTEDQTGQAQAPPANLIADLIRSAAELQGQFGTNPPEDKQSEIRQTVGKLTEEEFASLRQILGSAILAQAEFPADHRQVNVAASLEVVSILLGQRQAELTAAAFTVYEVLVREGFRLTLRNGYDRPLMTVSSVTLLRNHFRRWLDSHESGLGENELVSAQKVLATLERLILAAPGDEDIKEAIRRDQAKRRCDQAKRLRERIISSQICVLNAISEELVAAQPATKEEALQQVQYYLYVKRIELAAELRAASFAIFGEAEATIRQILDLHSACSALRREMAEVEIGGYDPAAQRPTLTNAEKRLAFFELERKELDSIRAELETALKEGTESPRNRKKLWILLAITADKLRGLDQLIAGLRPAPAALGVRHD